jgi:DNA-3-methyladenine glycosylase II
MPQKISIAVLDEVQLAKALRALERREPRFSKVIALHGKPSLRHVDEGLASVLQMVTEQFLSLAAAAAIWKRFVAQVENVTAEAVLACPQDKLLALGLSRAKAKSFHGLAEAVINGFDFSDLRTLDDAAARKALIALPGIGPWTADIYLLSCLLRADAWPWGDVALQAAAQNLFDLPIRPGKSEMLALGAAFQPHRATAARLLWAHYRGLKQMSQA